MRFKSRAIPGVSEGSKAEGPELVVPNQALSLQEILKRFTRNQPVAVGREASFDEGEEDLEKVAHGDLVDRAEFVEKQKELQRKYKAQEEAKEKAERDRVYKEAVKLAAKEARIAERKARKSAGKAE